MLLCRLRQGTRTIYAEIAAREAVAGNLVHYRGSEWQVVSAPPEWWCEGQRA